MADAPIGTEAVETTPVAETTPGGATSTPSSEPTPLEMAEDTLIRVKGQDKPIKFSEYGRGFQSQFTKASQKAAALEAKLKEREAQIQQYEQQKQRQPQNGQNGQPDVFDALRQLPYLTGEDAHGVVQQIGQAIQQRDQVLLAAIKKIQAMEQLVGGLNDNHSSQLFDAKINRWLSEGGYDPAYADLAKEMYLAYEGDDLDTEFPQIFASRVEQIRKIEEARKAQAVQAARRNPFVPGKGGNGNPSKPLEVKANATAREVADQLFGTWSGNET